MRLSAVLSVVALLATIATLILAGFATPAQAIPPPGAMACNQAHPNDQDAYKECVAKRLEGNHLSRDVRDCLVAAGITTAGVVVGGVIGGAAARAIAGGIIGGGGAACVAKIAG